QTAGQQPLILLLDALPTPIVVADTEGHVKLLNRAFEQLSGFERWKMIGKILLKHFFPMEEIASVKEWAADRGVSVWSQPYPKTFITKRGGRLIEWRTRSFLSQQGKKQDIVFVGADITEQKQREEELLKVSKLESAGLLAAGIAHDFNNLLAIILG